MNLNINDDDRLSSVFPVSLVYLSVRYSQNPHRCSDYQYRYPTLLRWVRLSFHDDADGGRSYSSVGHRGPKMASAACSRGSTCSRMPAVLSTRGLSSSMGSRISFGAAAAAAPLGTFTQHCLVCPHVVFPCAALLHRRLDLAARPRFSGHRRVLKERAFADLQGPRRCAALRCRLAIGFEQRWPRFSSLAGVSAADAAHRADVDVR